MDHHKSENIWIPNVGFLVRCPTWPGNTFWL